MKAGFFPPHSEVIYIRHSKTNMVIFIIFRKFLQASKRNPTTTWSRFTVSLDPQPPFVLPRSLMGLECPWRNGRGKCQGPIADFIIQTQNLLHHFIGHRESNYIVVQFSTQWLYWGSKSVFMMGKNVLLFYLLPKIKKYVIIMLSEVFLPPAPIPS